MFSLLGDVTENALPTDWSDKQIVVLVGDVQMDVRDRPPSDGAILRVFHLIGDVRLRVSPGTRVITRGITSPRRSTDELEEALQVMRAHGIDWGVGDAAYARGSLAELRGDVAGARTAQQEALAAAARIGLEPLEVLAQISLALLDLTQGALDQTRRRLAEAANHTGTDPLPRGNRLCARCGRRSGRRRGTAGGGGGGPTRRR